MVPNKRLHLTPLVGAVAEWTSGTLQGTGSPFQVALWLLVPGFQKIKYVRGAGEPRPLGGGSDSWCTFNHIGIHMSYQGTLSRMSFENALTPDNVKIMQRIQSALMFGVLSFALAVLIVYVRNGDTRADTFGIDTVRMMTIVHLVFFAGAILGSRFLTRRQFSVESLFAPPLPPDTQTLAERCVARQRVAVILGLAPLEGAAFFGLTVCIVGATNGTLQELPYYWINALSPTMFLAYGVVTFPTKDRLADWFEKVVIHQS